MKVLYPLSADPITNGHLDIIKRASRLYEQVVVAIAQNLNKKYTFELWERLQMVEMAIKVKGFTNVEVVSYKGLTVDFAWENTISTIIKGVRNIDDYKNEVNQYLVSSSQNLGIELVPFFGHKDKMHISSSAVKELVLNQGMVEKYVPLPIKERLEQKLLGQKIIGLTGEAGAGKSYLGQKLAELGQKLKVSVHHIELDKLGHQILESLSEPRYQLIRKQIKQEFGLKTQKIDRKILSEIVFNCPQKMKTLNQLMHKAIAVRLRRCIFGKRGLIILDGALLAEADMLQYCNNHIILIKAKPEIQAQRLSKRGLDCQQIQRRISSQYSFEDKKAKILKQIQADNFGQIFEFKSSQIGEEVGFKAILDKVFLSDLGFILD
jgi:pantetheine-phosphate adenylyltransferase